MGHAGRWVAGGRRCINTKLDDLSPEGEREKRERGRKGACTRERERGKREHSYHEVFELRSCSLLKIHTYTLPPSLPSPSLPEECILLLKDSDLVLEEGEGIGRLFG